MDLSKIKTGLNTQRLTVEILNEKFVEWNHKWSQGRDDKDIRFGQWIHLHYRVPESSGSQDGFYAETPAEAYSELLTLVECD